MAKRVVVRIGDIFRVKLDNDMVGFFQYVTKDNIDLGSAVIRVFKTHYPSNQEISLNDIILDDVDFYTHVFPRAGLILEVWEKVGHAKILNKEKLEDLIFGICHNEIYDRVNVKLIHVNPLQNWKIWKINDEWIEIGSLPEYLHDKINYGCVYSPMRIKERMETGYYKNTEPGYEIVKRIPKPEVYSFVKFESGNEVYYLCFHGNDFDKGVIPIDGKFHKITKDDAISKTMEITNKKFSDTNWKYQEFITEEEFNAAWNSLE